VSHNSKTDAFFMCAVQTQLTQTGCVDNGGGSYTANYDLLIEWSAAPISENILVTVGGANIATIDPALNTSPQTVAFTLDADGMGQDTILTFFETTTTCADTITMKSPSPCPPAIGGCTQTGSISLGLPSTAEEALGGSVVTNDARLELVDVDNMGTTQTVGLNYDNVNIPSGATITSASIQFQASGTAFIDPVVITIKGENVDDAAAFSTMGEPSWVEC